MMNQENALDFVIEHRHAGMTRLSSIKGYASILRKGVFGELSEAQRQILQVIFDSCETPFESWITLTELIYQNKDENAMEILREINDTGQSRIQRDFIDMSVRSLEIAETQAASLLKETSRLSDEQLKYVEIINNNCGHELEIWKEMRLYFS